MPCGQGTGVRSSRVRAGSNTSSPSLTPAAAPSRSRCKAPERGRALSGLGGLLRASHRPAQCGGPGSRNHRRCGSRTDHPVRGGDRRHHLRGRLRVHHRIQGERRTGVRTAQAQGRRAGTGREDDRQRFFARYTGKRSQGPCRQLRPRQPKQADRDPVVTPEELSTYSRRPSGCGFLRMSRRIQTWWLTASVLQPCADW